MAPLRIVAAAALAGSLLVTACGEASGGPHSDANGSTRPRGAPELAESGLPIEHVVVGKKEYKLELAYQNDTRIKGLSDRTEIAEDGGMLFAFPSRGRLYFVMRDCFVDIDIIFLDDKGRITAMHAMKVEPPRREDEPKPDKVGEFDPYEERLARYSSRYEAQFAIELKGGTLAAMDEPLEVGDTIRLDLARLKKQAEK